MPAGLAAGPRSARAGPMDRFTSSQTYRMTYVAVPLIAAGLIVAGEDSHFHSLRDNFLPSFRHHYDDYLQYAPAIAMLGLKIGGIQGRSSWGRMLVSDAFSASLMAIAVNTLKHTVKVMRPDGSNRHSFPSGHSATAFMTATMLHKEYGMTRSPWYSIGAYTAATLTGLSRQMNNKHWLSDVLVGAGIGILSTEVGYYLADLIFKGRGITYARLPDRPFDPGYKPSFFGLYLGLNLTPGRLRAGKTAAKRRFRPEARQASKALGSSRATSGSEDARPSPTCPCRSIKFFRTNR